ncbi:glutamate receptor 1 [Eupeodes corollae]|uniref:Putative ionotropic receptor IR12 n=1 Tax=Scaeva pyrastri TaxID=219539 RepID=A0A1B3B7D1_SCAPY|nr:glutamate receptor 1 [Eupeodes corollae]AOE48116.1 putative ionotropic receptor IR12 [Scaeva pyrastri]
MTSGFDLILSAILCFGCNATDPSPQGQTTAVVISVNGTDVAAVSPDLNNNGNFEIYRTKRENMEKMRQYVNGNHFRIATIEDYPLSYTQKKADGTVVGAGVSFELIDFLAEKFNFTYEVVVPQGNIIGSTGDYKNSLVELLYDGKADLAAAFLPLLADVRIKCDYSTTVLDEGEWIMVMQRPKESATGSGLLAPFEFWVWILIFISLLAVGPIIYVLIIIRNKITGDDSQQPYSLGHCAWFVYGALMKQGSTLSPIADSTRLLFATWWIFITILTSFYTANLTAFLTLSKFTLPFNTVNDILAKQKHFVTPRGGGIEYSIKNTNESLSILSNMVLNNRATFTENENDTVTLTTFVEKYGYVFVRDRPAINHLLYLDYRYRKLISADNEKIHCPFAMAKEPFLKKKRAFAYPFQSNLSTLFDPELLNLVESGIIKHLLAKGLPNAEICPQDLGGTERQLQNGDLMMTYYIMIAGFVTSIVVFTTEMLFRFINQRQVGKNNMIIGANELQRSSNFRLHGWAAGRTNHRESLGNRLNEGIILSNVTPPPAYASIFKHNKNAVVDMNKWKQAVSKNKDESKGVRRLINGRDYMVYKNTNGINQLVPVRAPSATLFQYSYTE